MTVLNITHLSKISIQLVVVIYQIDSRSCCPGAGVWQRARKPFSKAEGHTMTRPEATLPTDKSSVFDCGKILSVTNLHNINAIAYTKDEATGHGFRATASSLLNESGKWHPDAIERQLAHIEGNSVRAAYARGEHWDERVSMMQWWADYLDQLRTPAAGAVLEKAVA